MNNSDSLSLQDIEAYDHRARKYGKRLRSQCPIHGGDHQQSLSADLETGLYFCFQCGAKGMLDEFKSKASSWGKPSPRKPIKRPEKPRITSAVQQRLVERLWKAQQRLSGSPGQRYLESRGIPLELAFKYGAGYIAQGKYANRVVFPLHGPSGLMNCYMRSIRPDATKAEKHRYLPVDRYGSKGIFNYAALGENGDILVCEGVFNTLSLIAAGYPNSIALGGTSFNTEWFTKQRRLILCLDSDDTGKEALKNIGIDAAILGLDVHYLPPEAFAPYNDLNELWVATSKIELDLPAKDHLVRHALKMGAVQSR